MTCCGEFFCPLTTLILFFNFALQIQYSKTECNTFTQYIYKRHLHKTFTQNIYKRHLHNTFTKDIYTKHLHNTFTKTFTQYIYTIHLTNDSDTDVRIGDDECPSCCLFHSQTFVYRFFFICFYMHCRWGSSYREAILLLRLKLERGVI